MNLTPEQILEKIEIDILGKRIDPVKLASYLASIQPKEEKCPCNCMWCEKGEHKNCGFDCKRVKDYILDPKEEEKVEPSLLSIPRPKGWSVGDVIEGFYWWIDKTKEPLEMFEISDDDIDRYYQEFLRSLK